VVAAALVALIVLVLVDVTVVVAIVVEAVEAVAAVYLWRNEQTLVCLSNKQILDASRRRPFHCKLANVRCFL